MLLPFRSKRIMIAAIVIVVEGAIAAAHLVARYAYATVVAFDESAKEPMTGSSASRAPFGVVIADALCGLEKLFGDDCGNRNRNPLVTGTADLAGSLCKTPIRDGGRSVVVRPTYVRLVAQQASNG